MKITSYEADSIQMQMGGPEGSQPNYSEGNLICVFVGSEAMLTLDFVAGPSHDLN